jgi:hypothetical protein
MDQVGALLDCLSDRSGCGDCRRAWRNREHPGPPVGAIETPVVHNKIGDDDGSVAVYGLYALCSAKPSAKPYVVVADAGAA